jgi:phosphatidylserine decarboxylase
MNPKHAELVDKILTAPQYILPHHVLGLLMHYATHAPLGGMMPKLLAQFVKLYKVDMSEAEEEDLTAYQTFNEFFTRRLKADARPLAESGVVSPVDGTVSQIGKIEDGQVFQAKGHDFSLQELFGGKDKLANLFTHGVFCTIYLAPNNYHRIHMPVTAQPLEQVYVPGRIFSVSPRCTRAIPRLFARNERVITLCRSEAGALALVKVGALFVGSIETVWEDVITPRSDWWKKPQAEQWEVPEIVKTLPRGGEIARFNMGSTVILLFDAKRVTWLPEIQPGMALKMGQQIGTFTAAKKPNKPVPKKPAQ